MSIRNVPLKDKRDFDSLALHPLQSWAWGEFRIKTGIEVVRLGRYERDKLTESAQLTIHQLPFTSNTVGYLPKSGIPSHQMLQALYDTGKKYKCIFIKLEPNIRKRDINQFSILNSQFSIRPSPHPLFTRYTFQLDLSNTEEELLKKMHPKTRYNIKVALKHDVKIREDNSSQTFEKYLELTFVTTQRQKFYAHNRRYHQLMWETLRQANIAHLLTASLNQEGNKHILVTWILFLFNDILYYPYGASSNSYKNTMASNLMMWEAIKFGKSKGAKVFDLWGSLGPNPDPNDPWFGFHRFKQGYGAEITEFVGSFDLVIEPHLYRLYNLLHKGREIFLRFKSNLVR